ncbi:hypothetical protein ACA910_008872 [Epithemia clementina (nom. ined.)]
MEHASYEHHQPQNSVVIPGQLIAVSRDGEEESSFLRGHGTYIEEDNATSGSSGSQTILRASVTGTIQRVNKLISVIPLAVHRYEGHVGDLVVGRIVSVGLNRWKVQLVPHQQSAILPLSGVHLPGGVQRMRTQQDAREMRQFLTEGDLVSAEVHKTLGDNSSLQLHTRSTRYGKLENGCWIQVPPGRIPKRKQHYVSNFMQGQFDILLGCNGWIWMQRATSKTASAASGTTTLTATTTARKERSDSNLMDDDDDNGGDQQLEDTAVLVGPELAELQEAQRAQHAASPYSGDERKALARLRNAVECLRLGGCIPITVESIERVYQYSLEQQWTPTDLLHPNHVVTLTNTLLFAKK